MKIDRTTRQQQLLSLLRQPIPGQVGQKRSVYQGRNGHEWFIEYSTSLPAYSPFQTSEVRQLVADGLLDHTYKDFDFCFNIPDEVRRRMA